MTNIHSQILLNQVVVKLKREIIQERLSTYSNNTSFTYQPKSSDELNKILEIGSLTGRVFSSSQEINPSDDFSVFSEPIFEEDEASIGLDRIYTLSVNKDLELEESVEKLNMLDSVEYAEPNVVFDLFDQNTKYEYYSDQWQIPALSLEKAWEIEPGLDQVSIGIIDSGISKKYFDFEKKYITDFVDVDPDTVMEYSEKYKLTVTGDYEYNDYDPEDETGHGTHVASILCTSIKNNDFIRGVVKNCKLTSFRVFFSTTKGGIKSRSSALATNIAKSIQMAAHQNVHVLNMSLGQKKESNLLRDAIKLANNRNIILIAATGNWGSNTTTVYPASYPEVLAVSALQKNGEHYRKWNSSNYGPNFNKFVSAPGDNMLGLSEKGGIKSHSGTSFAAPLVAGTAALLVSICMRNKTKYSNNDLIEIIRNSCYPLGDEMIYGMGIVNAENALIKAKQYINSQ